MRHFYSVSEEDAWNLPPRLINSDIRDMVEIIKLLNGTGEEASETTEQDIIEAAKFHLKPPIAKDSS